jgi:rSAM/selenodomain-associated transferase 1
VTCLLVVAKAPVSGFAKTRLSPAVGERRAARLAAAALLDTVDAVLATLGVVPVVAMTGAIEEAERSAELTGSLSACTVIPQRGKDFAARLANAHADAAALHSGRSVLQIGMDTPQLRPELLAESVEALHAPGIDAVLGPATDGGWWCLGLRSPSMAGVLRTVPMSRSDTGARTEHALRHAGLTVGQLPELSDVDIMADAFRVAALAPATRFAAEVGQLHQDQRLTTGCPPPVPGAGPVSILSA